MGGFNVSGGLTSASKGITPSDPFDDWSKNACFPFSFQTSSTGLEGTSQPDYDHHIEDGGLSTLARESKQHKTPIEARIVLSSPGVASMRGLRKDVSQDHCKRKRCEIE